METARHWCKCLRIFFQIFVALFPAFVILFWLVPKALSDFLHYVPLTIPVDHDLMPLWHLDTRIMAGLLSFIPAGFTLFIFYHLSRLFKLYEEGIFLSRNNIRLIRKIGIALLFKELIFPFYLFLLYYVLTRDFPKAERWVPLDFTSANFTVIITGILIVIITKVTLLALKAKEELN